jgi:hypothetical protein
MKRHDLCETIRRITAKARPPTIAGDRVSHGRQDSFGFKPRVIVLRVPIRLSAMRARGSQEAGRRSRGVEFAPDSPLEEGGFEPSVPGKRDDDFETGSNSPPIRVRQRHVLPLSLGEHSIGQQTPG